VARRAFTAPRRLTEWSAVLVRINVDGLSGTQTFGTGFASESAIRATSIRLRGHGQFRFRPAAADDAIIVGLGLIHVSSDAFAVGATAVPSPIDDLDGDWVWHRLFAPAVGTQAFAAGDPNMDWIVDFEIDSKAQRKIGPGDTLVFVADGLVVSGSPVADISATVRELAKVS